MHIPPQLLIHNNKQVIEHPSLASAMASVSSGSRDYDRGEASMEVEAREMSRLAARVADMSRHAEIAARRSCRAAEAAWRSRRAVDAADWSGRAMEAAEMSRRAATCDCSKDVLLRHGGMGKCLAGRRGHLQAHACDRP